MGGRRGEGARDKSPLLELLLWALVEQTEVHMCFVADDTLPALQCVDLACDWRSRKKRGRFLVIVHGSWKAVNQKFLDRALFHGIQKEFYCNFDWDDLSFLDIFAKTKSLGTNFA